MRYVVYDPDGFIVSVIASPTAPSVDSGNQVLAVDDTVAVDQTAQMVQAGALVAIVPTLAMARQAKIVSAWNHYSGLFMPPAGFTWGGTLFQIDPASQSNIAAMGSLATASLANPTSVPWPAGFYWIAADNSHNAMTAAAMLGFAASVAGYVSQCVLRLRAIKDEIAAAPDQPTLDAIDVTAGYPVASA